MTGTGEQPTYCPVCAATFTSSGRHVLKRLPCGHTVCGKCVSGKLMKNNNVHCPLCSKSHQCVIEFTEQKTETLHPKTLCTEHQREKNLFCTEPDCKTPICVLCLKDEHKNHDFGDLDEVMSKRCEALLVDVQSLKRKIQINENRLIAVQNKEMKNSDACIESIREYEEELVKKIRKKMQKMVKKVQDNGAQLEHNLKEAVDKMKDTFQMLESIEETSNGSISHNRLIEKIEAVNKSRELVRAVLSNVKEYVHVTFEESRIPDKALKNLCGQVNNNSEKIKFGKIKKTNKKVEKEQMLDEEEADDSRVEQSGQRVEGSTGNEVGDVESEMSVQEIGDDKVKTKKTKLTRKRKTKDTPEKGSVAGSSSEGKDANNQTTPSRNKPGERSLTRGSDIPNGKTITRGSDIPNGKTLTREDDIPNGKTLTREDDIPNGKTLTGEGDIPNGKTITRGSDMPNGKTLTGEGDIPNGKTLTREGDIPNGKTLTRGLSNTDLPMNTAIDDSPPTPPENQEPPAKRSRWDEPPGSAAIKLKNEVSIATGYVEVFLMCLVPNYSVVVCGTVSRRAFDSPQDVVYKVTQYSLTTGAEIYRDFFPTQLAPSGMAMVTVAGTQCLAFSYEKKMQIDLYEVGNLQKVKWIYRVGLDQPHRLATSASSPEVLLYLDVRRNARDVRQVDYTIKRLNFRTFPPKISNMKTIRLAGRSGNFWLYDLCSISQGNNSLVISSLGYDGVQAHDARTGNIKWKVFEKLPGMEKAMRARGIATDDCGHLFVCDDDNHCVQMLSLKGDYLCSMLRYGEQNLGIPNRICWCHKTSSFVIVHREKNGLCFVDVFTKQ